ncbi:hypothetical protein BGZ88_004580 [Linnemannia elongata]|nr:hypothetical protein BGZ88_004580 [Linnemannia elongata]
MANYEQEDEEWFQNMGWHFDSNDDFVDKHGNMFDFGTQSDYYEFVHDKLQEMLHARLMQDYGFKKIAIPWDPNEDISRAEGRIPHDCPRVFATTSSAKCVMFVAFSAGAAATLELYDTYRREFMRRVKAVVLMDGATGSSHYRQRDGTWLFKSTKIFSQRGSAGPLRNAEEVDTNDHDSVPGVAVARVFEFLEGQHNRFIAQLPDEQYHWIQSLYHRQASALGRKDTNA